MRAVADSGEILRVEGLSKRFGKFEALRSVSFCVRRGETVGFLGRNGAGKSTTIKILCNLIRPSGGQAWLEGEPILGVHAVSHHRVLGAIVETPCFYPHLTGRKNLALVGRLAGVGGDRVEAMLAEVGLEERAGVPFGQFSLGMKQRLGLAAAFLHAPRLVILDEPTNGLDPVGQRQIRELIRALTREQGVGALLCSHLLDEVAELCDRAMVIEQGQIIMDHPLAAQGDIDAVAARFEALAEADAAPIAATPPRAAGGAREEAAV